MEGEIKTFIEVWATVFASLTYCYFISKNIPKGFFRLLLLLPIVSLFLYLPLNLTSVHLSGTTGFYIAWLANFKLLLFAFGRGPLSSPTSLSLAHFISVACFPIKIKQKNPSPKTSAKSSPQDMVNRINNKPKSFLNYAIKGLLLDILIRVYDYKQYLHPYLILFLYCLHLYFTVEIILAIGAALARFLLGLELEPQFDDPYLSTSLQDFWGWRWNLMVTGILRPTVYEPVRYSSTRIFGKKWGLVLGLLATFAVSGLMHELMFYYVGREWPTWEVMLFFALHGLFLAIEIHVKKALNGRSRLHPLVSRPLTVGFVMVTGFWLFFPQLLRSGADVKSIKEYAIIGEYWKSLAKDIWVILGGR